MGWNIYTHTHIHIKIKSLMWMDRRNIKKSQSMNAIKNITKSQIINVNRIKNIKCPIINIDRMKKC